MRQYLLRQLHRFIGRAAGTVGFEHLFYHFPQPRLALGDLATTTARMSDALGTATGTLWGVIVVAHGLQTADSRMDRSPAHPQHSRHIRDTAKADLQRIDRGVAASVVFRQRTEVDLKSSCD